VLVDGRRLDLRLRLGLWLGGLDHDRRGRWLGVGAGDVFEHPGDGLGCFDACFGLDRGDVGFDRGFGLDNVAGHAGLNARDFDVALCAESFHFNFAVERGLFFAFPGVVVYSAFWAEHVYPFARMS
jgi:hypothetical protein